MKICLLGPTYPFRGGISHYTTILYQHLKKKHDTLFISFVRQYPKKLFPGKTDIDPSQESIREPGAKKILDSMNPFTWIKSARIMTHHKPDLVIIPWWVSFWAPQFWTISCFIKIFTRAKILFLCHNVVEHESKWLDTFLTRMVLRNGNLFIVHSDEDYSSLKQLIPGAVVKKTFHPNYDIFNRSVCDPEKIKKRFHIKGNVILFFGFVRPYKGLRYLIDALSQIIKTQDVTLIVIGEFWKDKQIYISMIDQLGLTSQVIIVDEYVPNEEIGNYFCAADLVVQPYTSATGSGVVQIAFAFNKPVIATSVGSLPEVIDHGQTGFLVEPKNSKAIAQSIEQYFNQTDKQQMKENILKGKDRFSWHKLIDVIENLSKIEKKNH